MEKTKDASRVLAGMRKQSNGRAYEQLFQTQARLQGIACTRIPDGCRSLRNRLIRIKSPFDWVLSLDGRSAMIDTKSLQKGNLTASCINESQVCELMLHEVRGVAAGYVFFQGTREMVYFYSAGQLWDILHGKEAHPLILGKVSDFSLRKIFELSRMML